MKQKRSLWQSVVGVLKDNSPFMTKVAQAALLAELNLCTLLASLPVVTAGAALTALHATLLRFDHLTYGSALKLFFRFFRQAFRPTLPLWLLTLAAGTGLTAGWYTVLLHNLTDDFIIMLPLLLSSAVMLFTASWLYPLCASHLMTGNTPRLKELLASSLLLSLRELLRSFGALVLMLVPIAAFLWAGAASLTMVGLWILFGISPFALLHSKFVQSAIIVKE